MKNHRCSSVPDEIGLFRKACSDLGGQSAAARALHCSVGMINHIYHGRRRLSAEKALEIERLTDGRFWHEDLAPDFPWGMTAIADSETIARTAAAEKMKRAVTRIAERRSRETPKGRVIWSFSAENAASVFSDIMRICFPDASVTVRLEENPRERV